VQWHFHGPGFSETFHGRKRWFLYPSPVQPKFNPDHTCLQWLNTIYVNLVDEERPLECTIEPGDILYFPHGWYHAILNLDEFTVFMSAFSFL
jgi:ribosomal protein L16 Arg81 hydroxylase